MSIRYAGPWPELAAAHSFLTFLSGATNKIDFPRGTQIDQATLAQWLIERDLGPLAYARCRNIYPELANQLQGELFLTAGQNSLHWRNLQQIDGEFAGAGLSAVLLKGAALAGTVYDSLEQRSMADVDLWLRGQDMGQGCSVMSSLEFYAGENATRPLALQMLSDGEIQFYSRDVAATLVELHLSPFEGWWLKRTAAIDTAGLWARKEALAQWNAFFQLAAEDMIIQLALHLAVGHQFGMQTIRSLIDIALTVQARAVNWQLVAGRAREWRVATAVWLVLFLVQQLIDTLEFEDVLSQLQPSAWRRRQLRRFVSPETILAGETLHDERERYLFLLLLVDRPQDAGRLVSRTIWPETEWLDARYGGDVDHWQHIRRVLDQDDL